MNFRFKHNELMKSAWIHSNIALQLSYQYGVYFPESKITPTKGPQEILNLPGTLRHMVLRALPWVGT